MNDTSRGPNGNGTIQKWHVYVALLTIVSTGGTLIFKAGFSDAQLNEKVSSVEKHVDYDDTVFIRADVVNARLNAIDEAQHRFEGILDEQSKTLEQLLLRR